MAVELLTDAAVVALAGLFWTRSLEGMSYAVWWEGVDPPAAAMLPDELLLGSRILLAGCVMMGVCD